MFNLNICFCNPSHSGGRYQDNPALKPARAKCETLISTNWEWWCASVIPAMWEVWVGGSWLRSALVKIHKTYLTKNGGQRTWDLEVVE
jgi:hypothetical protein